ncbi:MAG: phosphate acyltransferase PlsX [Planctomycetota bacterium]|nr:phosphate acyltransferase PlsX [Planctomycetota bacterium]
MRIAIDAMGGDKAPQAPVQGALQALAAYDDVELVLAGDPSALEAAIREAGESEVPQRITLHDAPDAIGGAGDPVRAIRKNPRLSARAVADLLQAREVDAVITMGNTGAAVAAATLRCKRLEGVRRLGIAVPMPRPGGVTIVIDAGANPDSRPEDLHQYAIMAAHYVRHALEVESPRTGILSIGEERHKGNRLVADTWEVFERSPVEGFVGNVEPRELFEDRADVVVCDGFVGNVVLKTAEGMGEFCMKVVQEALGADHPDLARQVLGALYKRVDYSAYGGAPLLGLHGGYLIGHGRSGPAAYVSAVGAMRRYLSGRVADRIVESLTPVGSSEGTGETA